MKEVYLEKLDIRAQVPDSYQYVFGGRVWNPSFRAGLHLMRKTLHKDFFFSLRNLMKLSIMTTNGSCAWIQAGEQIFLKAYIQRSLTEPYSTFTQAHEETHALGIFGQVNLLEEAVVGPGIVLTNNISAYDGRGEVVADIGGLYAVLKRFGEDGVKKVQTNRDNQLCRELCAYIVNQNGAHSIVTFPEREGIKATIKYKVPKNI